MKAPSCPKEAREAAYIRALEATDDYLAACEQLGAALKAGWFSLARARYANAAVGQATFPGDMAALARVSVTPPPDPDDLYDCFELLAPTEAALGATAAATATAVGAAGGTAGRSEASAGTPGPSLHEAGSDGDVGSSGSGSSSDESSSKNSGSGGGRDARSRDPLRWFGGGLPPPDLRHAQRDFGAALRAAVEAANRLQSLRGLAEGLIDGGSSAGEEADTEEGEAALRDADSGGGSRQGVVEAAVH